jgi:hypothetical protein
MESKKQMLDESFHKRFVLLPKNLMIDYDVQQSKKYFFAIICLFFLPKICSTFFSAAVKKDT